MKHVVTTADLTDAEVDSILARAGALAESPPSPPAGSPVIMTSIFLQTSLRTKVGYHAAASRLGWRAIDVTERRHGPTSWMESWEDTLRTVTGYSDVVVARPGLPLVRDEVNAVATCPLINGGDTGPLCQHPSQALIDMFAIQRLAGTVGDLRIALVGDLRMRAAHSLLDLLSRRLPAALTVLSDVTILDEVGIPAPLDGKCNTVTSWDRLGEQDVVYVVGLPDGAVPLDRRADLQATGERVAAQPPSCIILSPLPVIDEMDAGARRDPRNRMFEQSDLALFVRMALLEHVVRESR